MLLPLQSICLQQSELKLANMGLQQPLWSQERANQKNQVKLFSKQQQPRLDANLETLQNQQPKSSNMKKIKFTITLLTILLTSFQVYDITTTKLQHSRNFVRFLNYYLIQHTGLDIYWAGQYMLNYPVQEYFQVQQVKVFLQRFQKTMQTLDGKVYGFMEFQQFTKNNNKIYLQPKEGGIQQYDYVIEEGFKQPFTTDDIFSIKTAILSSQEIQIMLQKFKINQHTWNVMISITTFSECSIFVRIYAHQQLSLWEQHIATFIMGVILLSVLVRQYLKRPKNAIDDIPDYLLCVFLINTYFISLDGQMNVEWLVISDGIQCLISWLLILKFIQKQDDYHISFLLRKSYILVGRLFISFAPIFMAFTIFAYALFCRQAWQFGTFKRTFFNLFYISYYNMTYESFIVTSRANPISMIFFFVFVILFTICVYSGMLVSVFCSYVWNKRESKIKQDIINNLKIQCSECDYKYKYIDCLKIIKQTKRSVRMSIIMQIDFTSSDQRYKYKKILQKKIGYLTQGAQRLMEQSKKQIGKQKSDYTRDYAIKHSFQKARQNIKNLLYKQFVVVEQNNNSDQGYNNEHKNKNKTD